MPFSTPSSLPLILFVPSLPSLPLSLSLSQRNNKPFDLFATESLKRRFFMEADFPNAALVSNDHDLWFYLIQLSDMKVSEWDRDGGRGRGRGSEKRECNCVCVFYNVNYDLCVYSYVLLCLCGVYSK